MAQSYIMLDVNDERAAAVAEVLSNKTCKRILQLLAEKELSETEISQKLKIPANTANYNVKKLVEAGLIEKAENFWSVKGKKVPTYKVSNKKILISPKPLVRGILPVAVLTGLATIAVKLFTGASKAADAYSQSPAFDSVAKMAAPTALQYAGEAAGTSASGIAANGAAAGASGAGTVIASAGVGPWAWFLLGAWGALLLFVVFSMWRRS